MQIDLDSYVSPQLCLSHTYSRHKLSHVAEGLCYLHSRNIVHGDLKGVRGFLNLVLSLYRRLASQTSLLTTPGMRSSRTLARPRLPKAWIPCGAPRGMVTPHDGLPQRSWGSIRQARSRTSSPSRWS